jgi:hypothetical protein
MAFLVEAYPPFRECNFCLTFQGGSVFADFDIDEAGLVFLRRISFDGCGCCTGQFKKMAGTDSRLLIESVERGSVGDPKIQELLRRYFAENADVIWRDALASHKLL